MIKVKTFQKKINNSKVPPVEEMASVINDWQVNSNFPRIISIETQHLGGGYGPLLLTATVWYEGEETIMTTSYEEPAPSLFPPLPEADFTPGLRIDSLTAGFKE